MAHQEKITELGGKLYYKIFLAGANKILENQKLLNQINVFPVPDADTGTNLASTLRAIIDNVLPDESFKVTSQSIAVAALNGARGNSGVIFAQFLYGMSVEVEENANLTVNSFANALKNSIRYIYEAVAEPVEGTMLTVIKDWAEYIYAKKDSFGDFVKLFDHSYEIAITSLLGTTQKLKALKLANVVDAGAKGFVLFLEGLIEGLIKRDGKEISKVKYIIEPVPFQNIPHENCNFRYCTEALIKSSNIDKDELRKDVKSLGDSLVIAGSEKMIRLHIHTDSPHFLFEKIRKYGDISYQKADDMVKQNEVISNRKWKIALVCDSTSDLSPELIDYYQIQVVPLNIHFGESMYLDKLTLKPQQFYDLAENSKEFPSTSQPNEASFVNVFSHLASHYESVIAVQLSGKFSGTFNSSRKAAEKISTEMNKKITVLDSKHVSGTLGLLTLKIAMAIESGMSHDEIVNNFEKWRDNTRLFVSVKNLSSMIKGGRVSRMKGLVANILNLKPIVSMAPDGSSTLFDKAFSQKASMKKVMNHIDNFLNQRQVWNYIILHAASEENAQWFRDEMYRLTDKDPVTTINISPVVGLHAGKGAAAIALIAE